MIIMTPSMVPLAQITLSIYYTFSYVSNFVLGVNFFYLYNKDPFYKRILRKVKIVMINSVIDTTLK